MWLEEWCEIVSQQRGLLFCWQCRSFFQVFLSCWRWQGEQHCWTMMILLWMVFLWVMVFKKNREKGRASSQLHLNCTTTTFDGVKRLLHLQLKTKCELGIQIWFFRHVSITGAADVSLSKVLTHWRVPVLFAEPVLCPRCEREVGYGENFLIETNEVSCYYFASIFFH